MSYITWRKMSRAVVRSTLWKPSTLPCCRLWTFPEVITWISQSGISWEGSLCANEPEYGSWRISQALTGFLYLLRPSLYNRYLGPIWILTLETTRIFLIKMVVGSILWFGNLDSSLFGSTYTGLVVYKTGRSTHNGNGGNWGDSSRKYWAVREEW